MTTKESIHDVFLKTPACGAVVMAGSLDRPYVAEAFGTVHRSSKAPMTLSTLFDTQSITKVLATSSLLEFLFKEGKIRLDDPAKKYVSELDASIRIKDLLLHQSGLSDEDCAGDFRSADEMWRKMLSAPLRFKPGGSVEYSDVGYRMLGLVLERAGGSDLDTLCKKSVWRAMGMETATYNLTGVAKENIAGGPNAWGFVDDAQDKLLAKPLGCDGVFASGKDLVAFCKYWLTQLRSNAGDWYQCAAGEMKSDYSYFESLALGKIVRGWEKHHPNQSYLGDLVTDLTLEKAGGAGAFIAIRPERGDYFIYLTNHGRPDPFTVEAWNAIVSSLRVREIAAQVLPR